MVSEGQNYCPHESPQKCTVCRDVKLSDYHVRYQKPVYINVHTGQNMKCILTREESSYFTEEVTLRQERGWPKASKQRAQDLNSRPTEQHF
jgi:hypothetical protein